MCGIVAPGFRPVVLREHRPEGRCHATSNTPPVARRRWEDTNSAVVYKSPGNIFSSRTSGPAINLPSFPVEQRLHARETSADFFSPILIRLVVRIDGRSALVLRLPFMPRLDLPAHLGNLLDVKPPAIVD